MSSRIVLDLKNFRHVKTDKDMTTLEHKKDKHQISLHHPSLSPESQAQLKALAGISKHAMTANQAQEAQDQAPKRMADGGETVQDPKQPNPPIVVPGQTDQSTPPPRPKTDKDRLHESNEKERARGWWADGGEVDKPAPDQSANPMVSPDQQQLLSNYMDRPGPPDSVSQALGFSQPPQASPGVKMPQQQEQEQRAAELMKSLPQPQQEAQASNPALDQPQPPQAPMPAEPTDQFGTDAYMNEMNEGIAERQKGIQAKAEAASQMGSQRADADIAYQAKMQELQNTFNKQFARDNANVEATVQDIKANHINPRHYQENMDTGSKIRTAIGLMLGGMGAGLTHGPNLAAEFFNKQIDRDIAAQQNAQENRTTLLHAYQQQYQNHNMANTMTKATLQSLYGSQIMQAADQAATPQARAMMLEEGGKLQMESANLVRQATMMKFMMQGAAGGAGSNPEGAYQKQQAALMVLNPELAKANAARHVSGVGDAPQGTVIPDDVKKQIVSHKSVNDLMNMSLDLSKEYANASNAFRPSIIARANTVQNQLIGQIKQAQHDGVYKPSEAEFLLEQIGNSPVSMLAKFSSVPKIREMQDIKQSEYNNLLDTYGLPRQELKKGGSSQTPEIKTMGGKKHQKDPQTNRWNPIK